MTKCNLFHIIRYGAHVLYEDTIRVPRSTRRKIRQTVHYLDRYFLSDIGLGSNPTDNVTKDYGFLDPIGLERAVGQLLFWKWVEPDCVYVDLALIKLNNCQKRIEEAFVG